MLRLILGLGNPGAEYRDTRHNVGFRVVESLRARRGQGACSEECGSSVSGSSLVLACPQTYMNRSGYAARCLLERRGAAPSDLLVVLDDVHLPLGRLRLRGNGGAGGHRGLESILESLSTDAVARLRIGVGTGQPVAGEALADYVLTSFADGERQEIDAAIERAVDACELWLSDGTEMAMNRINGDTAQSSSGVGRATGDVD